ncbi:MAG: nucleotidyltransferase family protein [bacterium]
MITIEFIIRTLALHKSEIFKNYNLKELGIFGSSVRGENHTNSDIDMIVEYNITPDLLKYIELENYIEKILNVKVDLVIKNSIKPELKSDILSETIYL